MPRSKRKTDHATNYHIEDLGRPAVFLIPVGKLQRLIGKYTIEEHIESFLTKHFQAFTVTRSHIRGYWKRQVDDLVEYEVSFLGKQKISVLFSELARLAHAMDEECIYIKTGEDTKLIHAA